MSVQLREIVENFPELVTLVRGSGEYLVEELHAPSEGSPKNLIFVANRLHLKEALKSKGAAWVVHKDLLEEVPKSVPVLLSSPNVQLSMSSIGRRFFPLNRHFQPIKGPKIHPSAQIAASAKVGAGCTIGPGVVIGEGCEIGENCIFGANVVIEPDVKIGAGSHIHPLVFIGHSCELGKECEIHPNTTIGSEGFGYARDDKFGQHRITHYGKVILEDRVHIGANVSLDRGTYLDSRIGSGTKIDNHCHFGHNFVIGKNSLITAGLISAGSVTVGDYCVFGGRTTINGHIEIASKTQVSAISVVSKPIEKGGEYGGFPLQPLRDTLKTRAAMRHLPEMLANIKKILKHLGLESE